MLQAYYKSDDKHFTLLHGDSLELLAAFQHSFDMIVADPPYFLSNDGLTVKNGEIRSVNKGAWDKSEGDYAVDAFNQHWIGLARALLKPNGTLWISGTKHNIFSVGHALQATNFKILNIITWEKTNPPPNFSKRYFTHSSEHIIWARKFSKVPHYYNYDLMKKLNNDKQMKDVWRFPAVAPWEKTMGKHPTQKPLALLVRMILAATQKNAWILDPFTGSSTTGIAANLLGRRFLGIDSEKTYLDLSIRRKKELKSEIFQENLSQKIRDVRLWQSLHSQ